MSDANQPKPAATIGEGEPKLPSEPAADSMSATPPRTYLINGQRLPAHPASELFPLIGADTPEGKEFRTDMQTYGQREPVLLDWSGTQVVDGRNRCIAAEMAKIPVKYRKLPRETDLVSLITSANLHRRHMATGQRALIAAGLANLRRGGDAGKPKAAQNETATRESSGNSENVVRGEGRPVGDVDPVAKARAPRGKSRKSTQRPQPNRENERLVSQADAARQMGVSVATLRKAKAVGGEDPILSPALKAGTVSIHAAYKVRDADDETKKRLVSGERGAAPTIADVGSDWTAPDWILSIVRQVLDQRIDLDPASTAEAQETIQAKRFLTPEDDALKPETSWGKPNDRLHVWLHPPGETASLFKSRLLEELQHKTVQRACWFGPAAFEAPWYRQLLWKSSAFATFAKPVRKGASQSYVCVCFGVPPMRVHEAVGDRGLVSTVFRSPTVEAP